jgi:hypothetical protein
MTPFCLPLCRLLYRSLCDLSLQRFVSVDSSQEIEITSSAADMQQIKQAVSCISLVSQSEVEPSGAERIVGCNIVLTDECSRELAAVLLDRVGCNGLSAVISPDTVEHSTVARLLYYSIARKSRAQHIADTVDRTESQLKPRQVEWSGAQQIIGCYARLLRRLLRHFT